MSIIWNDRPNQTKACKSLTECANRYGYTIIRDLNTSYGDFIVSYVLSSHALWLFFVCLSVGTCHANKIRFQYFTFPVGIWCACAFFLPHSVKFDKYRILHRDQNIETDEKTLSILKWRGRQALALARTQSLARWWPLECERVKLLVSFSRYLRFASKNSIFSHVKTEKWTKKLNERVRVWKFSNWNNISFISHVCHTENNRQKSERCVCVFGWLML